jgi:hypothetical protein
MYRIVRMISAAATLTLAAGVAQAGVYLPWLTAVEVDNSAVASLDGFTTYDLYWNNFGSETATVNGFNLGTAAQPGLAPFRVFYTGEAYNDPIGSDVAPNPAFFPVFPALEFDSYFTVGTGAVSFVGGSTGYINGEVLGTWFTQPPQSVAAGAALRFMRLTVSGELNQELSTMEVGFTIPPVTGRGANEIVFGFVPTPGAAALLGLGGIAAIRRRR